MNLADTIEMYAYGTSEGAYKGWEHRARARAETFVTKSHTLREGNLWDSGSGLATTGEKEAHNAFNKARYFAKTRGFAQIGTMLEGGKTGYFAGRVNAESYLHPSGATLKIHHDTSTHRVSAELHAPPEAHQDFEATMKRKDLNRMMYEMALREWTKDPRRITEVVGK